MDSGNSGSMQSSSGGDDEYDSRPESLPSFLNTSTHFINNNPLTSNPQPYHHHHHQPNLFDPSPNLFHPFSHQSPPNPNPHFLNLDVVPQHGLRSDHPGGNSLAGSSSSTSSSTQSILVAHQGLLPSSSSSSQAQLPLSSSSSTQLRSSPPSDHHHQTHGATRNPKKRTRASRRAPTTVLKTDTSNFRAMVQEFTGIPAPPFSGSPYARRFDLFGTAGSAMMRTAHLDAIGSLYPLRPLAQKVPFAASSSSPSSASFLSNTMVDATNIASTPNNNNSTRFNAVEYQLASASGLPNNGNNNNNKQPQNIINQMLSFQPLLQSPPPPPLNPSLNVPNLGGAKPQGSHVAFLPSLEDLGMSSHHGHVNANIGGGLSSAAAEGNNNSINYGNNSQRVVVNSSSSCKLNYTAASSSDFHEKGLEHTNVSSSRGEAGVDMWICPSE